MPNVQVRDLEFNATTNTLAAFTLGRGVFQISTSLPAPIVVNTTLDETTPADGLTSLREAVTQAQYFRRPHYLRSHARRWNTHTHPRQR